MKDDALAGLRVLVTRPQERAAEFARALEDRGGEALIFPAVEITGRDPATIEAELRQVPVTPKPLFVFVSLPAVEHGLQSVTDIFGEAGILNTAAVGPRTAARLAALGCGQILRPTQGNGSEALLEVLAGEALQDRQVVILRGPDGRDKIARELEERGAMVRQLSVYDRRCPAADARVVEQALAAGRIDAVTVTSAGIYENLRSLLGDEARRRLRDAALLVPSERVVTMVRKDGARGPVIRAGGADDAALLSALADWQRTRAAADAQEDNKMSEDKEPAKPSDATAEEEVAAQAGKDKADQAASESVKEESGRPTPDKTGEAAATPPAEVVIEKKSGGALAALALLLALGAAGASGYLWWQDRQASTSGEAADAALSDTRARLQSEVTRLEGAITSLDDQFSDLLSDQQGAELKLRGIDELNMRLQSLASELETMRGVSDSARRSWAVAEAAYFLQAANTALHLGRNVDAASNALGAADDRLASLGDPAMLPVREAIAAERQALAALPDTDVTGIALTLGRLADRAADLPTLTDDPESYATPGQPEENGEQGGMERARRVLGDAMKSMVTVRRTDQQATALLAPEEEFFLARNLELQLLTARLALLREQPELFTQSVDTSLGWLREFFDPSAPEVASTIETLEQMRGTAVRRSLPDISASLTLLRSLQDGTQ